MADESLRFFGIGECLSIEIDMNLIEPPEHNRLQFHAFDFDQEMNWSQQINEANSNYYNYFNKTHQGRI